MGKQGVDKRGAAEHFKVTARAPVLIGAIEHCTRAGLVGDLFQGKGAADEIFSEPLASGGVGGG